MLIFGSRCILKTLNLAYACYFRVMSYFHDLLASLTWHGIKHCQLVSILPIIVVPGHFYYFQFMFLHSLGVGTGALNINLFIDSRRHSSILSKNANTGSETGDSSAATYDI